MRTVSAGESGRRRSGRAAWETGARRVLSGHAEPLSVWRCRGGSGQRPRAGRRPPGTWSARPRAVVLLRLFRFPPPRPWTRLQISVLFITTWPVCQREGRKGGPGPPAWRRLWAPHTCPGPFTPPMPWGGRRGWTRRGTCLQPGGPRRNQVPPPPHPAAETLPRPRATVSTVAGRVKKTVQRSHPDEIPPKRRLCGMFNFELPRGETSGSGEARWGDI